MQKNSEKLLALLLSLLLLVGMLPIAVFAEETNRLLTPENIEVQGITETGESIGSFNLYFDRDSGTFSGIFPYSKKQKAVQASITLHALPDGTSAELQTENGEKLRILSMEPHLPHRAPYRKPVSILLESFWKTGTKAKAIR